MAAFVAGGGTLLGLRADADRPLSLAYLHYHLPLATAQQVVDRLNSALAQLASHQK